jgi:hypothetical protein
MSHPITSNQHRWLAHCLQRHIEQRLGRRLELHEDPAGGVVWLRREERCGRYAIRTSVCVRQADRIEVRCIWFAGEAWRFDGAWGLVDNCNPRHEARASSGFRAPSTSVTRKALEWAKGLCDAVTGFQDAARLLSAAPLETSGGSAEAGLAAGCSTRALDVRS